MIFSGEGTIGSWILVIVGARRPRVKRLEVYSMVWPPQVKFSCVAQKVDHVDCDVGTFQGFCVTPLGVCRSHKDVYSSNLR